MREFIMLDKFVVRVKSGSSQGDYLNLNEFEIEFTREPGAIYDEFRVALIIAESAFHRDKISELEIIPVNFGTSRYAPTVSEISTRFGDLRSLERRQQLLTEHLAGV